MHARMHACMSLGCVCHHFGSCLVQLLAIEALLKQMAAVEVARASCLRFTQCSVGAKFRNGDFLLELACALVEGVVKVGDIEPMEVTYWKNVWWSLDNRRLAVFRVVEFIGVIYTVPVKIVSVSEDQWRSKFDTDCFGEAAVVRGPLWRVSRSAADTTFPLELVQNAHYRRMQIALWRAKKSMKSKDLQSPSMKPKDHMHGAQSHEVQGPEEHMHAAQAHEVQGHEEYVHGAQAHEAQGPEEAWWNHVHKDMERPSA